MAYSVRRVTEQTMSDWRVIPEGPLYRFEIDIPQLILGGQFGPQINFPLMLTESERARLMTVHPLSPQEVAEGVKQSWKVGYRCGIAFGYIEKKSGTYKSTKLVDFVGAALGQANTKAWRQWLTQGGGAPRPADKDDQQAELKMIEEWLGWIGGMEIYGSIRHELDRSGNGQVWARFGGPMPIGSLPGQPEPEYQAVGLGKLRSMQLASETETGPTRPTQPTQPAPDDDTDTQPAMRFNQDGTVADGSRELPF